MSKIKAVILDNSIFRRSLIVCLFLANISFVQIVAYASLVVFFVWGVFLLFYNEIKRRTALKTRMSGWLMAFVLMTTVTAVIHIADNFLYNLAIQFYVCCCFFIFYSVHTEKELNFRRELYAVCRFIVYVTTVTGIIGVACLMADISFEVMWVKFIVYENRFTGLYANPNMLAFDAVVAIFCCHMLTKKDFIAISGHKRVSRIWMVSCLIINAISLLLCDSNAALVLMIAYIVFFVLYKLFGGERKLSAGKVVVKGLALVLAGVVIVASMFFIRYVFQAGFTQVLDSADALSERALDDEEMKDVVDNEVIGATARVTFSHENKNLDSGRLRLWRQAAKLIRAFPIFGIGRGNVYSYGETMFENGIAFSDLFGSWLSNYTTDFHNGYITILVCSGVVGFVLFVIFLFKFWKHITVYVFKKEDLKESILPCMWSFLCGYLVYAMFEKTLLYDVSFRVMFFWMIMGYVGCFLEKYEPSETLGTYHIFGKEIPRRLL